MARHSDAWMHFACEVCYCLHGNKSSMLHSVGPQSMQIMNKTKGTDIHITCPSWQICSSQNEDIYRKQCNSCISDCRVRNIFCTDLLHVLKVSKLLCECISHRQLPAQPERKHPREKWGINTETSTDAVSHGGARANHNTAAQTPNTHTHIVTWQYQPVRETVTWAGWWPVGRGSGALSAVNSGIPGRRQIQQLCLWCVEDNGHVEELGGVFNSPRVKIFSCKSASN